MLDTCVIDGSFHNLLVKMKQSLVDFLVTELKYHPHPMDACAFVLPASEQRPSSSTSSTSSPFAASEWLIPKPLPGQDFATMDLYMPTAGRVIVLTDDILDSGDERHRTVGPERARALVRTVLRAGIVRTAL